MEIFTSVRRLYIRFKSLVNDFVYSFGRAAPLLLVEVQNHTVPVRERGRIIRDKSHTPARNRTVSQTSSYYQLCQPSYRNYGSFLVYVIQSWYPEPEKIQNCLSKTKSSETFINCHTFIECVPTTATQYSSLCIASAFNNCMFEC